MAHRCFCVINLFALIRIKFIVDDLVLLKRFVHEERDERQNVVETFSAAPGWLVKFQSIRNICLLSCSTILICFLFNYLFHEQSTMNRCKSKLFPNEFYTSGVAQISENWCCCSFLSTDFSYILWIINHLIVKLGQAIEIDMGNIFRKNFAWFGSYS